MSQFGLNNQVDLNSSLLELPGNIFLKLRDTLDLNPRDKDWRALIRAVEDEYKIKPAQVERWSNVTNGKAADKLINELSSQGMTVQELVQYLDRINVDTYNLQLSPYKDIEVLRQPPETWEIYEGSTLTLEVNATGQPYPRYQWFFCPNGQNKFESLQGRTEKTLRIPNASLANAGGYSCQIHNCGEASKTKLTDITLVAVTPDPNPQAHQGLNPPEKTDIVSMLQNLGPLSTPIDNSWEKSISIDDDQDYQQRYVVQGYNMIIRHPHDITVGMNEPFLLAVETSCDPPITYSWYRNGQVIPGECGPKLHVAHALPKHFGEYYCMVCNGLKSERSQSATVKENFPLPKRNTEIVMISQPKSARVDFSGSALFSCEARCCEPIRYQWFKDGRPLDGETNCECKIVNIQDRRHEGMYQCEVSVALLDSKVHRRLTSGALLTVTIPDVRDNIVEYNPSDKVALLIGNYDYRMEQTLRAPKTDVQVLSETFHSLDFKVVSLLNLTKPEIENAVLEFCKLVDKNVYAVFYFCGHGFEENGHSFLVPTDAPAAYKAEECVCADIVLENIQRKDPPLICMIMDICRKSNRVQSSVNIPQCMNINKKGNTVFCYATSVGLNAFEDKTNGLLVQHLHPLLRKPIGIDAVMSELREEFSRFPKHSKMQVPELRSNLLEPRRSLTDRISNKGDTEAFQRRTEIWTKSHEKPEPRNVLFPDVGVRVQLDFQSDFSNVMHIFAMVVDRGITLQCTAEVCNYPPTISRMGDIKTFQSGNNLTTKISLQDIQKLQSNLIIDIQINFILTGNKRCCQAVRCDLGLPLVARLHLWQHNSNFTVSGREATEQGEEPDSM